jgi:hypothetical protein
MEDLYLDGWMWKRSFKAMQAEQNYINSQFRAQHMTTDINVIESWMQEATDFRLTEKWTTGDSHRLVYDIGEPQQLQVHSAFSIDLNGKPLQVPACVVLSGDTDFEFFDNRAELMLIVDVKRKNRTGKTGAKQQKKTQHSEKPTNTTRLNVKDASSIETAVESWKKRHPGIQCTKKSNLRYIVIKDGKEKVLKINTSKKSSGENWKRANAHFEASENVETFMTEKDLNKILDKMLVNQRSASDRPSDKLRRDSASSHPSDTLRRLLEAP